jgi:hypothetical protein
MTLKCILAHRTEKWIVFSIPIPIPIPIPILILIPMRALELYREPDKRFCMESRHIRKGGKREE